MAKYRREVTEFLLDQIDIVDVIGRSVPLKKAGRNHKGLCPFHSEKTPSFVVSADKQFYHCFGCGASGNAISFVMNYENMAFLDALESLAERSGIDLTPFIEDERNVKRHRDTAVLYDVMRAVARQYYKLLRDHSAAGNYVESRGISDGIAKRFGLGFAPDAWDFVMRFAQRAGISRQQLLDCGLIVKREQARHYDRFRNRLMFPIFDLRGRVVGFGGRVLDDALPKYLNSPESVIFHKSNLLYGLNFAKNSKNKRKQAILVEGYMDVIALHQFGYDNAVASLGTALTEHHVKQLARIYDEIIFAYDADGAGQSAIMSSLDVLRTADLRVKVLQLGDYKDPDELLRAEGTNYFDSRLEQAENTIAFAIKHLEKGYNLTNPDERIAYMQSCFDYIDQLSSHSEAEYYQVELAKRLQLPQSSVAKDYANWQSKRDKRRQTPVSQAQIDGDVERVKATDDRQHDPLFRVEFSLLALIIYGVIDIDWQRDEQDVFSNQQFNDILTRLPAYFARHRQFEMEHAIDYFALEQLELLEHLPKAVDLNQDKKAVDKLWKTRDQLVLLARRDQIDREINRLSVMNGSEHNVQLRQLLAERRDLLKKIAEINR